jgi:hypothetical protein
MGADEPVQLELSRTDKQTLREALHRCPFGPPAGLLLRGDSFCEFPLLPLPNPCQQEPQLPRLLRCDLAAPAGQADEAFGVVAGGAVQDVTAVAFEVDVEQLG